MDQINRTRPTALTATLFGLAACLLAAACGSPEPAATELNLVVQDEGPPILNGESQPLGRMLDTLRGSTQPITVRLPPEVRYDALWEVFGLLDEQLPRERAQSISVELPRASGDGYERFSEPPLFLVLTAEGGAMTSRNGSALLTLVSADISSAAAAAVALDPDALILLTLEDGVPADLQPRTVEQLRRMRVRNLMLFDDAGVRPLPADGDETRGDGAGRAEAP